MACALVVVAMAGSYAGDRTGGAVDTWARNTVVAFWPQPGPVARVIEAAGDPRTAVVLVGMLVTTCLALHRRRLAALALAGPTITGAGIAALEPLVGRTIHGELTFPDGHVGVTTALALVAALLVVDLRRTLRPAALLALTPAVVAAACLMAVTLVALDVGYATDAVGGFCAAVAVVVATARVVDGVGDALPPPPAAPVG